MKRADVSASFTPPQKRIKASQACASCRKSKTRCELVDTAARSGTLHCRRCLSLGMPCSYATSEIIHLIPTGKTPPPSSFGEFHRAPDAGTSDANLQTNLPAAVPRVRLLEPQD